MKIRLHIAGLLCHCGMPHLVVGVSAKAHAMRESLRQDALRARALDHKMTQLYYRPEESNDVTVLITQHRRYMNG